MAIHPRRARIDELGLAALNPQPDPQSLADELWPVVAAQELRSPLLGKGLHQDPNHAIASYS